jgi:hypothetical protein
MVTPWCSSSHCLTTPDSYSLTSTGSASWRSRVVVSRSVSDTPAARLGFRYSPRDRTASAEQDTLAETTVSGPGLIGAGARHRSYAPGMIIKRHHVPQATRYVAAVVVVLIAAGPGMDAWSRRWMGAPSC